MNTIRIIISDAQKLIREGWSIIISSDARFRILATCANAEEAIEAGRRLRPDIMLIDTGLGLPTAADTIRQLRQFAPLTRIIAVALYGQPGYVKKIMQSGARGYITKNSSTCEMIDAIVQVHGGNKFICKEVIDLASQSLLDPGSLPDVNSLTQKEMQIIELIRKGCSSKEIAATLFISFKTVQVHRHNILKKLKLRNATSLVNFVTNHMQ
jgi:DNA-binding NarL/FixJ family response regulator